MIHFHLLISPSAYLPLEENTFCKCSCFGSCVEKCTCTAFPLQLITDPSHCLHLNSPTVRNFWTQVGI